MSDLTLQQLKALRFWQTPEITSLNKMAAHTPLSSYRSYADATTGELTGRRIGIRAITTEWRMRRHFVETGDFRCLPKTECL